MASILLPVTIGALIELGGAAIGAKLVGLEGVSLGWLVGLTLEALYMAPAVYRGAFPDHIRPETPTRGSRKADTITPGLIVELNSCDFIVTHTKAHVTTLREKGGMLSLAITIIVLASMPGQAVQNRE